MKYSWCEKIISFRCVTLWFDICIHYECNHHNKSNNHLPHTELYNIIGHILYAVLYILIAYLIYNWKFVLLNPFYLLHLPTTPSPVATTHFFSVPMSLFYFVLFVFRLHLDHMVFSFIYDLFHLAQIFLDPALLLQVTRLHLFIYLFLWLNDIQV